MQLRPPRLNKPQLAPHNVFRGLKKGERAEEVHSSPRGLRANVRFFIDRAITIAVMAVTLRNAQRVRLSLVSNEVSLHVWISATTRNTDHGPEPIYIAHSNDMCFFTGSSPSLYVIHNSPRDLESSIYLYVTERFKDLETVSAQIFRERGEGHFELPVLEGCSDFGPESIKEKVGVASV